MSVRNCRVEHRGIVAVQSRRTKKIVLYIDNKRVLQITADCIFKEKDLVSLIDRHIVFLRGKKQ
jgi:hypothetical protein